MKNRDCQEEEAKGLKETVNVCARGLSVGHPNDALMMFRLTVICLIREVRSLRKILRSIWK